MKKLIMYLIFMIGFYSVFYIFKSDSIKKVEKENSLENLSEYQKMMAKDNKYYQKDNKYKDGNTPEKQMQILKNYQKETNKY